MVKQALAELSCTHCDALTEQKREQEEEAVEAAYAERARAKRLKRVAAAAAEESQDEEQFATPKKAKSASAVRGAVLTRTSVLVVFPLQAYNFDRLSSGSLVKRDLGDEEHAAMDRVRALRCVVQHHFSPNL